MRTLLRLEHLFHEANHYLPNSDTWSSRSAIDALLNMVNIFSRADIKADLIKELDRQREAGQYPAETRSRYRASGYHSR